ncbi:uncharacterized protein M421DRAFT_251567 [Didymella exigua CBS 183.55]|uniref:DUF6604 domain-containing protein n=1 Tax=Didymella exigua CBS 183.55 TaxID=1150837 RepID=A0A6A5RZ13_9PLEO|nr:uncharacterized protein M421DRAFT_251567 [Didymella exigua CBS 183.55]KAF1932873.1 hypothetical protein M421DRAFT_251567 [Didymella exigua CBS 183.55]
MRHYRSVQGRLFVESGKSSHVVVTCLYALLPPLSSNYSADSRPLTSQVINLPSSSVPLSAIISKPVLLPFISITMVTHFEPPLGSTFWAYRQATNDVVQWIASSARSSGSVASLFEEARPTTHRSFVQKLKDKEVARPSLMDKLKGRKRQPARPAKPTSKTADGSSSSEFEISYKVLSKLGRAIANTSKVEVDYNVLVVLQGIIHARKGFAT